MNSKQRSPSNLGLAVLLNQQTIHATISGYGLLLLLVSAPILVPGVITVLRRPSLGAVLQVVPLVILSAIAGGVLFLLSGTSWLHRLAPATFEGQGGGFAYILGWVPFLAYSGCVAGAWLVAFLSGARGSYPGLAIVQAIAVLLTTVLGGLFPLALLAMPRIIGSSNDGLTQTAFLAIVNGLVSAWLGTQLANWLRNLI